MWMWWQDWLTGFQMPGLLLIGVLIIVVPHRVEFNRHQLSNEYACFCMQYRVCVCMCVCVRIYCIPSTAQENETWLWIIPFRNKELAVWDARSLGTTKLEEACVTVSCYFRSGRKQDMRRLQACGAPIVDADWKILRRCVLMFSHIHNR